MDRTGLAHARLVVVTTRLACGFEKLVAAVGIADVVVVVACRLVGAFVPAFEHLE